MQSCPICLEDLSGADTPLLPCGHGGHALCLIGWFRRGVSSCPVCREELDSDSSDTSETTRGISVGALIRELRIRGRRKGAPRRLQTLLAELSSKRKDLARSRRLREQCANENRPVLATYSRAARRVRTSNANLTQIIHKVITYGLHHDLLERMLE